MNSTAKAFLIVGSVLMVCLTAIAVAFLVTDDEAPAPAPVATSSPAPVETSDPVLDILEEVWSQQSYSDQQALCTFFKIDPSSAYDSFNEGAEGLVPEDTFMDFFSVECASIT